MDILELGDNEAEARRHQFAILNLSRELKVPLEKVTTPYEKKLREIEKTAKVKEFIVLVVTHDVREIIKEEVAI
jgi:N-formylglutamate amidohydrolase